MTDASALRASGALHCNLNVRSLDNAAAVYEALGFQVRMRSKADGQDSTALGLPRPTDSEAWFLYDHRGGRRAPAVELVEWIDPPTTGDSYADPSEVGLQALGVDVADLAAAVEALVGAGGLVRAGGSTGVDATVLDADGVALELRATDVPAPTLRYARLVTADLEATSDWYGRLGFEADGPARPVCWATGDGEVEVLERPVVLAGPSPLELRLTSWTTGSAERAHDAPNHRGLFRMALAVPDVRTAVDAARGEGGIDASDATWIPLPGTPLGGLWVSFFRDPDGVMVEFVERPVAP